MLFRYKGIDGAGRLHEGYVMADSKKDAMYSLKVDKDIIALISMKRSIDSPLLNDARAFFEREATKFTDSIREMDSKSKEKKLKKRELIKSGQMKTFSLRDTYRSVERKFFNTLLINKEKNRGFRVTSGVSYRESDVMDGFGTDYSSEENVFLINASRNRRNHLEDGVSLEWDDIIPEEQSIEVRKNMKLRIDEKEVILFTKKLNMMISSGVPLLRALNILKDTSSKKMKRVLSSVIESIQKGSPLSIALSKFPRQFDSMYVSLVNVGETSGTLSKAFLDIIYYKEKNMKVKRKIKSASIYPIVVSIILGIMLVLGSVYFLPIFREMFEDQGVELPWITSLVFSIADRVPIIVAVIFALALLINILRKTSRLFNMALKSFLDLALFRIPAVKDVVNANYMFTFSSSTALMLENGIRLKDALQLTRKVIRNVYMKHQIASALDLMIKGYSFSDAISEQSYFDKLLVSVLITGEESGKMSESLRDISDYYDEDVNKRISSLMELVQPVFILLIAALVVPTIIAVYLPIMEITSGGVMGL